MGDPELRSTCLTCSAPAGEPCRGFGTCEARLPVGLKCPNCGEDPVWVFGDGTQAWCWTDDCPVLTWNPTLSRAELAADSKVIDLQAKDGP